MIRRSAIRILLSLLLLVSQQMAIAHAVSHWSGRAAPAPVAHKQQPGERSLSEAIALDQSCSQCLAFAQIGGMVGSAPFGFVPAEPGTEALCADPGNPAGARTVCAYRSRAPPVAI
jgi:hypothetical protein